MPAYLDSSSGVKMPRAPRRAQREWMTSISRYLRQQSPAQGLGMIAYQTPLHLSNPTMCNQNTFSATVLRHPCRDWLAMMQPHLAKVSGSAERPAESQPAQHRDCQSPSQACRQSKAGAVSMLALTVVSGVLSLQVGGHVVLHRDGALSLPYRRPILQDATQPLDVCAPQRRGPGTWHGRGRRTRWLREQPGRCPAAQTDTVGAVDKHRLPIRVAVYTCRQATTTVDPAGPPLAVPFQCHQQGIGYSRGWWWA